MTANLRVLPVFLVDGMVAGTWRIEQARSAAALVAEPFRGLSRGGRAGLVEEAAALVRFVEPEARRFEVKIA